MNDPGQWDLLQGDISPSSPLERMQEGEEEGTKRSSIRRKPIAYPVLIDTYPGNRTRPPVSSTTEEFPWGDRAMRDMDYVYDGRPRGSL